MPRQGHKHNVLHQKEEVTQNKFKEVTYKRVACEVRERKPNKNRTILTDINPGGKVNNSRYQNILPEHTTGAILIHPSETKQFSRGCNKIIWAQQKRNKGWVGICRNKKMNLWISASRTTSTTIDIIDIRKAQICANQTYPGIMETQMAADMFHPGS